MIVRESSWHARLFRLNLFGDRDNHHPTVCHYWFTILIQVPCRILWSPVMFPIVWVVCWAEERFKLEFIEKAIQRLEKWTKRMEQSMPPCPFGRIVFL